MFLAPAAVSGTSPGVRCRRCLGQELCAGGLGRYRGPVTKQTGSPVPRVDDGLPPLASPDAPAEERDRAIVARMIARAGQSPTLEHYRRVYEQAGAPWPGEDEIRKLHHVAPGPAAPAA